MKYFFTWIALFTMGWLPVYGQETVLHKLDLDFTAEPATFFPLIPIANSTGETGTFETTSLPTNFCPDGGEMPAYHFEKNSGIAIGNTDGFLDCEYTIDLLFKFDELPSLFEPPWISIVRFQPDLDNGVFLEINPLFGTFFEVWEGNTELSSTPFPTFNVNDWQKLTIVRTCDGMVEFYFGCDLFKIYNDGNQILLPEDLIVFFQDDPDVLAAEAQSGFVRNLSFSNYAKSSSEIQNTCDNICMELLENCLVQTNLTNFSCSPDDAGIDTIFANTPTCDSLIITTTVFVPSDTTILTSFSCIPDQVGMTVSLMNNQMNCDSLVIETTLFEEAPLIEYESTTCFFENVIIDTMQYDCDSIVITNVSLIEIDTLTMPILSISQGSTIIVLGQTVTEPGTYCETNISVDGCDSTVCQQVEWLVATSSPTLPDEWYVPNAFSPNGDGINDFFWIYANNRLGKVKRLSIFNASGQLVFQKINQFPNNETVGWDGRFRGQDLSSGVYLWSLEVELDNQQLVQVAGDLTLLR